MTTKLDRPRKTRPLWIHKSLIIQALTLHPEDLPQISPGYTGTAEEAVAELRNDPGEWLVDGMLMTEADAKTKYPCPH